MEPFFTQSLLTIVALILVAASTSLLGVFVLWKKLSYFGDAISHSILLGAALGAVFEIDQNFSLLFFATIFAALVSFAGQNRYFSKDTIIAISSYFCVALAIILNDLMGNNLDFSSYLFGDISTASSLDITILTAIAFFVIIFAIFAFKKILLINIAPDLAKAEGIKIELWNFCFLILLTVAIAVSVRIVGVLLMTALLILPAAIARLFSHNALSMIILSFIVSIIVCALSGKVATYYQISVGALAILFFGVILIPSLLLKK